MKLIDEQIINSNIYDGYDSTWFLSKVENEFFIQIFYENFDSYFKLWESKSKNNLIIPFTHFKDK